MAEPQVANLAKYSVHELLLSGSRFVDDYDEGAAVEHYLQLHPDADRAAVELELREEIQRHVGYSARVRHAPQPRTTKRLCVDLVVG